MTHHHVRARERGGPTHIENKGETGQAAANKGNGSPRVSKEQAGQGLTKDIVNEKGDWEATAGWAYIGHGEWAPPEGDEIHDPMQQSTLTLDREPEWIHKWRCQVEEDFKLHKEVLEYGYPNRWGARRPVKTKWNLDKFGELLRDYHDKEVVEWIRYGWPTGRLPTLPEPEINHKNHKGARDHPEALKAYISKEARHGAIMGPFTRIPFQSKVGISPLSTRPKKDSSERRVILDLSFPVGMSVNDGIQKDNYLGFTAKLTFPRVDDFALCIHLLGKGCMMFKVDLSRYFRQLLLDPGDYSLIGYIIDGDIYFDKVLPMGMRSAPSAGHKCYSIHTPTDAVLSAQLCG